MEAINRSAKSWQWSRNSQLEHSLCILLHALAQRSSILSSSFFGYHLAHLRFTSASSSTILIAIMPLQSVTQYPARLLPFSFPGDLPWPAIVRKTLHSCLPGNPTESCETLCLFRIPHISPYSPGLEPYRLPSDEDRNREPHCRLRLRLYALLKHHVPFCLPPCIDRNYFSSANNPCMRLLSQIR